MNAYTSSYKAATKPATGLTLTELLVTTAIMAMMIAFTSAMLVPARKAIRRAQATVRANANARAVADRIRRDLAAIDKEGFIAILTDVYGRFHLVMVTAGNYRSMVDPGVYANVARIEYGVSYNPHKTDDRGTPDDKDDDIRFRVLYRRAVLLNPNDNLPQYSMPDKDHERMSPRYYHMPLFPITNLVTWLYARVPEMRFSCFTHPDSQVSHQPQILAIVDPTNPEFNKINEINEPIVQNLADLGKLWPFLVSEVADLESTAEASGGWKPRSSFMVQWTDGQVHNGHRWFPYYRHNEATDKLELVGRDGTTWMTRTVARVKSDLLVGDPEFVLSDLAGPFGDPTKGQAYCAFWCYTNRDDWPKALRVSFRVGQTREPYEIIVDMPY